MGSGVILKLYNGAYKLILDPDMPFNELLGLVRDKFYASRSFLPFMQAVTLRYPALSARMKMTRSI